MSAVQPWWQKMIDEMKRRRVFRVATLYIVALWPIIQIVDIASPALEITDAVMRYLLIAFFSGLPLALILAWIFDLNAGGVVVTTDESAEQQPLIGGRAELVIVGVLLFLVGGLFLVQLQIDGSESEFSVADGSVQDASSEVSLAAVASDRHSIGVLPFATFSDLPADERFADGLTEELLNVLVRVKALRVAARTSSFAYKGVNRNVTDIGRELNVGIILEGSVRRNDVDDTIRVTAQLIDTESGSHLWSKTYDREFTDIFKIQDDIANSVVDELQITLLGEDREKIQSRASAHPEAMVAYGMGQAEMGRRNEQGLKDAIRFFQRAIDLDPNYTDAHVGIATAHALMNSYQYGLAETHLPIAQASIDKAFDLDPESGAAWATLGLIEMQRDDKEAASQALEKAMAFNPSHALAYMWYASIQKDLDEKLKWNQKAYELDPRSTVIGYNVANLLLEQGREAEAMAVYAQIVDSDSQYYGAYLIAARVNEGRGRIDEAINYYKQAWELSPEAGTGSTLAKLYVDLGDFEQSQYWLAQIKDKLRGKYEVFYDWIKISSYASVGRLADAQPLLRKKLEISKDNPDEFALEDAALAAYYLRDYDTVIAMYERVESEATMAHFNNSNRIDAMLAVAHVYAERGMEAKRDRVIAGLEALMAEHAKTGGKMQNWMWATRSMMSLIEGKRQLGLVHFQRAIDEGWRHHWVTQVNPIFVSLEDDAAFQSMVAGLETRMDIMREQLVLASAFESDWAG